MKKANRAITLRSVRTSVRASELRQLQSYIRPSAFLHFALPTLMTRSTARFLLVTGPMVMATLVMMRMTIFWFWFGVLDGVVCGDLAGLGYTCIE